MADCIGCGYCCCKATCMVGHFEGAMPGTICEFLTYRHGRHWCGVIENAEENKKHFLMEGMAIGTGCSSSLFNSWRDNGEIIDRTRRVTMNVKELYRLQSELDSFSDRARRWSENLKHCMGVNYDIYQGSREADGVVKVAEAIADAAKDFETASRLIAELVREK